MRMGLPQVIISDQGREFNNGLDTSLAELLAIKRRLTTPYHPQVVTYRHNLIGVKYKLVASFITGKWPR